MSAFVYLFCFFFFFFFFCFCTEKKTITKRKGELLSGQDVPEDGRGIDEELRQLRSKKQVIQWKVGRGHGGGQADSCQTYTEMLSVTQTTVSCCLTPDRVAAMTHQRAAGQVGGGSSSLLVGVRLQPLWSPH
uniref:Uncharacterized protein n=1 Tax=Pipistrellus kuhlii TaxID=59472 RepID=A0A7J7RFH5_PIPKU|nr:hypothetical protein mPipKuh1_010561 [Pipistrellus kuhlii]